MGNNASEEEGNHDRSGGKQMKKNAPKKTDVTSRSDGKSLCIHMMEGRSFIIRNGRLPGNFPLEQFLKERTACKRDRHLKQRHCTFEFDPSKFSRSLGVYTDGHGTALLTFYGLLLLISLISAALIFACCMCKKDDRIQAGGRSQSRGIRSIKSSSIRKRSFRGLKNVIGSISKQSSVKSRHSMTRSRLSKMKSLKRAASSLASKSMPKASRGRRHRNSKQSQTISR